MGWTLNRKGYEKEVKVTFFLHQSRNYNTNFTPMCKRFSLIVLNWYKFNKWNCITMSSQLQSCWSCKVVQIEILFYESIKIFGSCSKILGIGGS